MNKRRIIRCVARSLIIIIGIPLTILLYYQWADALAVNPGWDYSRAEVIEYLFTALFFTLGINIGLEIAWNT